MDPSREGRLAEVETASPVSDIILHLLVQEFCSPRYMDQVHAMAASLPELGELCRASVCIPVAAHEEERYIERTLNSFLGQTGVDPNQYEIVLLANHPDLDQAGNEIRPDASIEIITNFIRQHPELNIRLLYSVFPREFVSIGYIRAAICDVVLQRLLGRFEKNGEDERDHLLVRLDADVSALHPRWMSNYITRFERDPGVGAFGGQIDWTPEESLIDPCVFLSGRFERYVKSYLRIRDKLPWASGTNAAIRAHTYAQIGGFNVLRKSGEDVDLDYRVRAHFDRLGRTSAKVYAGSDSRAYVSARRALAAAKHGHAAIEQWDCKQTLFGAENRGIRKEDLGRACTERRSFAELTICSDFVPRAQAMINQTIAHLHDRWPVVNVEHGGVLRALSIFGLKRENGDYKVVDEHSIEILRADILRQRLFRFEAEALAKQQRKLALR